MNVNENHIQTLIAVLTQGYIERDMDKQHNSWQVCVVSTISS
jgi:hypothetical protein